MRPPAGMISSAAAFVVPGGTVMTTAGLVAVIAADGVVGALGTIMLPGGRGGIARGVVRGVEGIGLVAAVGSVVLVLPAPNWRKLSRRAASRLVLGAGGAWADRVRQVAEKTPNTKHERNSK